MRSLKLLSLFFVLLFAFTACKKDDDPKASASDAIIRTWQIQKMTAKVGGFEMVFYEKGKTDNVQDFSKFRLTFQKDGKYTGSDEEGNKTAGTWALKENNTKLVIDEGTADSATFTVSKLSASNLDYSLTQTEDGVTSTVNFFMIPA